MAGRVPIVRIKITKVPLTPEIMGDYFNDDTFKKNFQDWLNRLWAEKDRDMDAMLKKQSV